MGPNQLFNFLRIDVEAAGDDHVFLPVADMQAAGAVLVADGAGM
jgi:hypothetical protein